jgi:succinate dehydrogenase hydrophobic anchor subunit
MQALRKSQVNPSNENAWLWLAKIVTGVLVIVLILVHIVVNHLVVQGGLLTYADVIAYVATPGIALLESCFLVIVVTHSLLGFRGIVLDLNPSSKLVWFLDIFLVFLGSAAILYGIWLMQVIVAQGKGV